LVPKKGADDLIDAVAMLPDSRRNVVVNIVGYGPMLAELKQKVRTLGLSRVVFHGRLSSSSILELLRQSSVFCLP